MNPVEAPAAKTHNLISIIFKLHQASLKADFQSKIDTALIRMMGKCENGGIFPAEAVFFMAVNRGNKIDTKWVGPGITIGRFGNKYALVHFRGVVL